MAEFLQSLVALPTVVFTIGLGVALVYWSLVFLGALDIDLLDFDVDLDVDGDGVLDGALEGLDGAAEGLDGAADGLDGAADGFDGALDGAAEGLDGATEGADGGSGEGGAGPLAWLLGVLRVRNVPITVSLSFLALSSWALSWLLTRFAAPPLAQLLPAALVVAVVGVAALGVAVPLSRLMVRPFSGLFHTEQGARRTDLIGQVVEVVTGRVDHRFGQGELATSGADLILDVRCAPDLGLTRGERALIVSYDPDDETYIVEPLRDAGQTVDAARARAAVRATRAARQADKA